MHNGLSDAELPAVFNEIHIVNCAIVNHISPFNLLQSTLFFLFFFSLMFLFSVFYFLVADT